MSAYEIAPPNAREQAVYLERLAVRLSSVREIPPETQKALSEILNRVSHQRTRPSRSAEIEARRQLAIARVAAILQQADRKSASSHVREIAEERNAGPPAVR
jgi:hypothetical protein